MNVNSFYTELFEDRLQLPVYGLENRCKELVRLVNRNTLSAFANYIPCYYLHYIELSDRALFSSSSQNRFGREYSIQNYTLDKYEMPILDIVKAEMANLTPNDPEIHGYYSSIIASNQVMSVEDILLGSLATTLDTTVNSAVPFKRLCKLSSANIVYLENYPIQGRVALTLKTKFPNIASIPDEFREPLLELAVLDIKIKLYPELKFIEQVVTPVGDSDLKISDWENAPSDRKSFIEELRQMSFPDRVDRYYIQVM